MSLLNIRNLSAPIRSKIQIGGLIIAAILVLVIRLGGGSGGSTRELPEVSNEERSAQRERIVDFLNESDEADRKAAAARGDGLLEDLVDGSFDKRQKRKQKEESKSQSFDEIRRSLGLE
jgi:hypothetical protein